MGDSARRVRDRPRHHDRQPPRHGLRDLGQGAAHPGPSRPADPAQRQRPVHLQEARREERERRGDVRGAARARYSRQALPGEPRGRIQDRVTHRDRGGAGRRLQLGPRAPRGHLARLPRREVASGAAHPRDALQDPQGRLVAHDQPRSPMAPGHDRARGRLRDRRLARSRLQLRLHGRQGVARRLAHGRGGDHLGPAAVHGVGRAQGLGRGVGARAHDQRRSPHHGERQGAEPLVPHRGGLGRRQDRPDLLQMGVLRAPADRTGRRHAAATRTGDWDRHAERRPREGRRGARASRGHRRAGRAAARVIPPPSARPRALRLPGPRRRAGRGPLHAPVLLPPAPPRTRARRRGHASPGRRRGHADPRQRHRHPRRARRRRATRSPTSRAHGSRCSALAKARTARSP